MNEQASAPTPAPLAVLEEDRARIRRICDRLGQPTDYEERADLATELVRAGARYLDVVENAVMPSLGAGDDERSRSEAVRQRMDYIHRRTKHIAARNAHMDDPEGLEQAIDDVVAGLRRLLDEHRALFARAENLPPEQRDELADTVAKRSRHASERPVPLPTAVGRAISNAATKLDHAVEDISSPRHKGSDTIDGEPSDRPARSDN